MSLRSYRKKRRPGNRAMNREESARIDAIKRIGCIACIQLGYEWEDNAPQPDAHHLLSGGIRIGHEATVALCKWHHSARLVIEGMDVLGHMFHLGPTLLQHPERFRAQFGTDEALLSMQNDLLRTEASA